MLQAQVNYWTLQENKRHNQATEAQGVVDLGIKRDTLIEARRHNVVGEQLGRDTLNENIRHNVQSETLGFATLQETARHNRVNEDLGYANLAETSRHNFVTEGVSQGTLDLGFAQLGETTRTHFANEAIGRAQAAAAAQQANAATQQARVAAVNADTNKLNAATRASEQDLAQQQYRTYVDKEIPLREREVTVKEGDLALKGVNSVFDNATDVTRQVKNVMDILKIVD
jgi:hypothetical protein